MNRKGNPMFQKGYPNAEMCNKKLRELPIWEKPLLTVVEAASVSKSENPISEGLQESIRARTLYNGRTTVCLSDGRNLRSSWIQTNAI